MAENMQGTPCPTGATTPLPADLAGWAHRTALSAAANAHNLGAATLIVGKGADVTLLPTPSVDYPRQPEKPGGSVSHGGLLAFTIPVAGTYRVALGSGAWVDVVRHGKAIASTAHSHGPACTGIMKMVEFPLTPGRYMLQLSANGSGELPLMISLRP